MTQPYQPQPPHNQGNSPPYGSGTHPGYAPGRGFVPPMGQPPPPPPPRNMLERVIRAVQNYFGLQQRARASGMEWWRYKFVQGLVFGTLLGLPGLGLSIFAWLFGGAQCFTVLGGGLLLLSFLVFSLHALAPITSQWQVTIPEGEYWALEDGNRFTRRFIPGGQQDVEWHWGARVVRYVDFVRVDSTLPVPNILPGSGQAIDLEVYVTMSFEPDRAPEERHAELRKKTRIEDFQHLINREVMSIIRYTVQTRRYDDIMDLLYYPEDLEQIVMIALEGLAEWGLFLFGDEPSVSVFVYGLSRARSGGYGNRAGRPEYDQTRFSGNGSDPREPRYRYTSPQRPGDEAAPDMPRDPRRPRPRPRPAAARHEQGPDAPRQSRPRPPGYGPRDRGAPERGAQVRGTPDRGRQVRDTREHDVHDPRRSRPQGDANIPHSARGPQYGAPTRYGGTDDLPPVDDKPYRDRTRIGREPTPPPRDVDPDSPTDLGDEFERATLLGDTDEGGGGGTPGGTDRGQHDKPTRFSDSAGRGDHAHDARTLRPRDDSDDEPDDPILRRREQKERRRRDRDNDR